MSAVDHAKTSTLTLLGDGRAALSTRIDTTVGRSSLAAEFADLQFLADAQFRLDVDPATGQWSIVPIGGVVNEILLDGAPLAAPTRLLHGQVIAVGNSRKGIVKLPLVVSLAPGSAATPTASDDDAPTPDPTPSGPVPESHMTEPELVAATHPAPGREGPTVPALARTLGAIAGGLLMGVLGAAADGRGTQVRRGRATYGEVLRRGAHRWGEIVAHLDGDQVRPGAKAWGEVIATLDGEYVREGRSSWGEVIANIEGGRRMAGVAAAAYLLRF